MPWPCFPPFACVSLTIGSTNPTLGDEAIQFVGAKLTDKTNLCSTRHFLAPRVSRLHVEVREGVDRHHNVSAEGLEADDESVRVG